MLADSALIQVRITERVSTLELPWHHVRDKFVRPHFGDAAALFAAQDLEAKGEWTGEFLNGKLFLNKKRHENI